MWFLKNNPISLILLAGTSFFLFQIECYSVTIMEARKTFITARENDIDGNLGY